MGNSGNLALHAIRSTQYAVRNTQSAIRNPQSNLVLTGFMGTGKTSVGRIVAERLGRPFVDLDDVIAARAGKPIPRIFAEDGEPAFRAQEAAVCAEMAAPTGRVIAAGGGAVVNPANRAALAAGGLVICLDATPDAILARVGSDAGRPMLAGADRRARIESLLAQRAEAYAAIPLHLDTTDLTLQATAERVLGIAAGLPKDGHRLIVDCELRIADCQDAEGQSEIRNPKSEIRGYPVLIAENILQEAGQRIVEAGLPPGRCAVVTNPTVGGYHLAALTASLAAAGFEPLVCEVPDGEAHKTLATVASLYEQFAAAKLARNEPVIALGGGVTGDMAGFAAATWLRGVPFVQIPTSLLAMVDSSVGGKTGVDLPAGKNLVGAFKQPALVLIDPTLLATLPPVELRCGLAETLKAGIIADPDLFNLLASGIEALAGHSHHLEKPAEASTPETHPNPPPSGIEALAGHAHHPERPAEASTPVNTGFTAIIAAAVRVKADIVARDPFERGDRAWLNLGHTFGHALELISGFTLRHGEAVGLGTVAAAKLSAGLGHCDADLPSRVCAAVARLGLPVTYAFDPAVALAAMGTDKKRRGRMLRFVLTRRIGEVFVADDVPADDVLAALESIRQM